MQVSFKKGVRILIVGLVLGLQVGHAADIPLRKIILADPAMDGVAADQVRHWQDRVRAGVRDRDMSLEQLGWAWVNLGRRTSDAGCYKLAAWCAEVLDSGEEVAPSTRHAAALLRGHAWLQQHRFAEAETLARDLVARRGEPLDYALLADATMEQGKLTESVAACQTLMNLRPGLEAQVRVAQLRWLHGDLPGAIEAMATAERISGGGDSEIYAWTRVRLAQYYLRSGAIERAQTWTAAVLADLPDYAPALLLKGQIQMAQGAPAAAATTFESAAQLNPLPEYNWWRAEAWRAAGDPARAQAIENRLAQRGPTVDPRTCALFLATRGRDADLALALAEAQLEERADAYTWDALAWAQLAAGHPADAQRSITRALETGLSDGRVWLHAAVIAAANHDEVAASDHARRAQAFVTTLLPSEQALLLSAADAVAVR